ncbi:hypothetical protein ASPSYDRAFT_1176753 [Aspergillus sydowii CBS 593.65]|uniref:Mitochondrial thiamine pyrophosphate carrier 1 n=1 Tax=Aspergillus sydowii CBS 593.65 TaxID=1036612 RepID=A0A1L9TH54_9EURO|nr:uncharacterized protein ASPSYDRAFT_1176753 [Aspergillus sydowii CBS 593.65]OJJ58711.1 hypothetical protein ASPSYDRAFT_1176753 [Aspergillus sydowii CBS 593.65]
MAESLKMAKMAESSPPGVVKEFLVGTSGGVTQVIIGQPFDIVKVRMQVQANKTAIQVARDIWKHEGPLAFYKGTLPPLLGVGACISIVYSTFHTISQAIHSLNTDNTSVPTLTSTQTYLAGGLSGLANSVISGPTEHIRIRLQTQSPSSSLTPSSGSGPVPYSGVYGCIRPIHSQAGFRGLYRGQTPTMLREFGSYGVWFCVYEGLLSRLTRTSPSSSSSTSTPKLSPDTDTQPKPTRREDLPTWQIASCGVITGLVLWSVNYPFDVVKSKTQADGFGVADKRYVNMRDVVRRTWKVEGVRGFFRGLGPTLFRAVPVSGGTFVVVEQVRKII